MKKFTRSCFVVCAVYLMPTVGHGFDIVAFGTSNTNCKGVDRDKIYPARLQELLRSDGIDVNVINAGVNGDKPVWMVDRITTVLTPGTRLVIFEPGPNDRNKRSNVEYSEKVLAYLRDKKLPTIYVSHGLIQSIEEAQETAAKFGASYYGHFNKDVPTDRIHRQYDLPYPMAGHLTAEGCQLWAKNIVPMVETMIKENNIR